MGITKKPEPVQPFDEQVIGDQVFAEAVGKLQHKEVLFVYDSMDFVWTTVLPSGEWALVWWAETSEQAQQDRYLVFVYPDEPTLDSIVQQLKDKALIRPLLAQCSRVYGVDVDYTKEWMAEGALQRAVILSYERVPVGYLPTEDATLFW